MRKHIILSILLSCLHIAARGQTIASLADIDLSGLPQPTQAAALRYWFNDGYDVKTTEVINNVQLIDVSYIADGLHNIHYQVVDNKGMVGDIASSVFVKLNPVISTKASHLRYWFDDGNDVKTTSPINGAQLIDVSHIPDGLHNIHFQVVDNKGMVADIASSLFIKINAVDNTKASFLRYWFDDDVATAKVINVPNGVHTLDVSGLLAGAHALYYQLIDSNGKVSTPVGRIFLKNFDKAYGDGGNRITEYRYWLNDNCQAMQTVTLTDAVNPYQLITLLPLQKEPIRSDRFLLEIIDGQPTVIAKNLFTIRFYDVAGSFSDNSRTFVDYGVRQVLTDVELLESGVQATTAKPAENAIKWYCLNAEPGDSVQFRLDRAATIQLFDPSGKEIYAATGIDAVNWGGTHVFETGTYYLALHDVTSTWGDDISIDYEHIDKYAVLRQDVSVVGNGGCSTITFEGNGFRDLYAVELFMSSGEPIQHAYIGHESDATTSIVFDFTDVPLGKYHAKFHFTEEDKVFENLVTVEEARDIELETEVTYPSTFLQGTSTTYTIEITNKGNMTAYAVPIYTWLGTKSLEGIFHIEYDGLGLAGLFDNIEKGSLSASDIAELKAVSISAGDDHHFLKFWAKSEEKPNDSSFVRSNYFFTTIGPNKTKTLRLTVSAKEEIASYFTVPKDWPSFDTVGVPEGINAARARFKAPSLKDQYCCIRSRVECITSITADAVGIANKITDILVPGTPTDIAFGVASCLADALNQLVSATGTIMCGDDSNVEDKLWAKVKAISNGLSIASTLSGCASKILPAGKLKAFLDAINKISEGEGWLTGLGIGIDFEGCKEAFSTPIPGCPPTDPKGGSSSSVAPSDPNDIFGYAAESSSHAIKDGLTDVYYTIDFENDPEFATAPAHEIVVKDTLDATKFDLSSFAPTRVKIGDKSAELDGSKNFVTTIDMRPGINAIAQVTGTFDETKGIATWYVSSLDPMTMEPTKYVQDGVLPVNSNGNGIGELMYDIKLKDGLAHGTEIKNRAGIVFDSNDVIMTPYWTNTIDRIAPESHITNVEQVEGGETATVTVEVADEDSGPWRYNVYVQYGSGAWFLAAENVPADTKATVKIYEGMLNRFYAVATDKAGNVEQKDAKSEFTLNTGAEIIKGDANSDNLVNVTDIVATVNYIMDKPSADFNFDAADVNGDSKVNVTDIVGMVNIIMKSGVQNVREAMSVLRRNGFIF